MEFLLWPLKRFQWNISLTLYRTWREKKNVISDITDYIQKEEIYYAKNVIGTKLSLNNNKEDAVVRELSA